MSRDAVKKENLETEERFKRATHSLLAWYREHRRDLPWRRSRDPYKIWISEIMLQQTRVDTVLEYYPRFIMLFPDIHTLAGASEEQVLTSWKGLGYYSRARNAHQTARIIVHRYGGAFPEDLQAIRALPGIGAYTAGAILSIAFGKTVPAIDGNVLRFIARLLLLQDARGSRALHRKVEQAVGSMMPDHQAADFTQALMEMGALVCIPGQPRCAVCPVNTLCLACAHQMQSELPVKKERKKTNPQMKYWVMAFLQENQVLMEYREEETLLGRLWGLPMILTGEELDLVQEAKAHFDLDIEAGPVLGTLTHQFTHRSWHMEVVSCSVKRPNLLRSSLQWRNFDELAQMAIPTAFQKVLPLLMAGDASGQASEGVD